MNEAHECGQRFLAAQCDAPEPLEFIEEAFDLMALFVELPVDWRSNRAAGIGLDLRSCTKFVGNKGP